MLVLIQGELVINCSIVCIKVGIVLTVILTL